MGFIMKIRITLIVLCGITATAFAQSPGHEKPASPASNSPEPGKVEWNGYDKKMSFSSQPYSGDGTFKDMAPDTTVLKPASSIHSQEWKPEKSSTHTTPCNKAKSPINL
jgi:hypothetical protein